MNRFVLTLLVLLAVMLPAYSVDKKYSFKHINSADGLSASNVKCILRDSRGFMWFGTKNGLNLYDGMDIERLKCFDCVRKHGNDNIGALYEDKLFTTKPCESFHKVCARGGRTQCVNYT